jgi:hypothetical protein
MVWACDRHQRAEDNEPPSKPEDSNAREGLFVRAPRLHVANWNVLTDEQVRAPRLPGIVRELLTPNVTQPLPESWHGPYSEKRAVDWIRERDAEGIQLLAVSRQTKSVVGPVLLHQGSITPTDPAEFQLGYLVSESQWGRGDRDRTRPWRRPLGSRLGIPLNRRGGRQRQRLVNPSDREHWLQPHRERKPESPGAAEIVCTLEF